MIGDKTDDILAGQAAGCRTVLVRTGQGLKSETCYHRLRPRPDFIADDLLAASVLIVSSADSVKNRTRAQE
jgi:D-glycero-D-manno-heptose 1,7-bisphosphate phosphatase